MTREIPLSQGLVALVDEADFAHLSQWKWYANRAGRKVYAVRRRRKGEAGPATILMHRVLLPGTDCVDHANGDGLDNRRQNLRAADYGQNRANTDLVRSATGLRGVSYVPSRGVFQAQIERHGKTYWLGYHNSPDAAARAYDEAAANHFGEFASLNGGTLNVAEWCRSSIVRLQGGRA